MTYLPLESWRQIIGYHPWHFWGWANSSQIPLSSSCNVLVQEYAWQNADHIGRSEIRRAIRVTHSRLREYLNFSIGKRWVVETKPYPRPFTYGHQFAGSVGGDSRWLSVKASEGMIRKAGQETATLIGATETIVRSDPDGDGLSELFTCTITDATIGTFDNGQLEVYFHTDDRFGDTSILTNDRWRIEPVNISVSGTTATITGAAYLLAKPIKQEGISTINGIDPAVDANYVTTLQVYRHYTDVDGITTDDSQATLVWETEPYPAWAACGDGTTATFDTQSNDPAALAKAIARVNIRNARLGELTAGAVTYDSDTGNFAGVNWGLCRQPDRIILRYECGVELSSVEATNNEPRIDGRWDEIVARLTAAELTRKVCGCESANQELYRWQFDLSRSAGANSEQYRISESDLSNPFGTRAGAVYAWNRVRNLKLTRAFLPG